jgi:hypothetical protein
MMNVNLFFKQAFELPGESIFHNVSINVYEHTELRIADSQSWLLLFSNVRLNQSCVFLFINSASCCTSPSSL